MHFIPKALLFVSLLLAAHALDGEAHTGEKAVGTREFASAGFNSAAETNGFAASVVSNLGAHISSTPTQDLVSEHLRLQNQDLTSNLRPQDSYVACNLNIMIHHNADYNFTCHMYGRMSTRRLEKRSQLATNLASASSGQPQPQALTKAPSYHQVTVDSLSTHGASTRESSVNPRIFYFGSTDTNATVNATVCEASDFDSTTHSLFLSNPDPTKFFELPSCIFSKGVSVDDSFTVAGFVINSFEQFQPNLKSLRFTNCLINPGTNAYGFDVAGNLDWTSIWSRHPNLTSFLTATSNFKGTFPATIPKTMLIFDVRDGHFTGSIPYDFFAEFAAAPTSLSGFSISFANQFISGPIPAGLFAPFAGKTFTNSGFSFDFSNNTLDGPIPANLLQPLQSANTQAFTLKLSNNKLSAFPSTMPFVYSGMVRSGGQLTIDLSQNLLTGSLPSGAFAVSGLQSFNFNAKNNRLGGPLSALFSSSTSWSTGTNAFTLDLTNNTITGVIPTDLLSTSISSTALFSTFKLLLGSNNLTGPIPQNLFSIIIPDKRHVSALESKFGSTSIEGRASADSLYALSSKVLTVDLTNNDLTGAVPGDLLDNAVNLAPGNPFTVQLLLSGNALSGEFPNSVAASLTTATTTTGSLTIVATGNDFWGSLPSACYSLLSITYTFPNNKLNGTFPASSWGDCAKVIVDVSNNLFPGELPPALLLDSVYNFVAPNTLLTGSSSMTIGSSVNAFDLSNTAIDFCTNAWVIPLSARTSTRCKLTNTNAACVCPAQYSGCQLSCNPTPTPFSTPRPPVAPPLGLGDPPTATPLSGPVAIPSESVPPPETSPTEAPIAPTAPVSFPVALPSPAGCNAKTRPSNDFECIDGTWVAASVTNTSVLVIPSGAGSVIVNGNVSSTSIVFNSIGSTVIIEGCASNLSTIVVELTQEQLQKLGKTKTFQNLVTLSNSSSCASSLNDVALSTKTEEGCRKVKTEKATPDANTFGAYFTMDSSGCNRWWIILVSVVVVVIIIGTVATVVGIVLWQKHQNQRYSQVLGSAKG